MGVCTTITEVRVNGKLEEDPGVSTHPVKDPKPGPGGLSPEEIALGLDPDELVPVEEESGFTLAMRLNLHNDIITFKSTSRASVTVRQSQRRRARDIVRKEAIDAAWDSLTIAADRLQPLLAKCDQLRKKATQG